MADDDKDAKSDDQLGEAGRKALEAERATVKDLKRQVAELKPLADAAQKAEEATKTEVQRLTDKVTAAEARAATAEAEALKTRVAHSKGLTAEQAEFLTGDNEEDLSARADKILALSGAVTNAPDEDAESPEATPAPGNRQENLSGGIDPTHKSTTSADIRSAVDAAVAQGY